MFCTACGSPLVENAKFCVKCGTPVPANFVMSASPVVQPVAVVNETRPAKQIPPVMQENNASIPKPANQTQAKPAVKPATQPEPKQKPVGKEMTEKKEGSKEAVIKSDSFKSKASASTGEVQLGTVNYNGSAASAVISGPGKEIIASLKHFLGSLLAFVKKPLLMIPAILFSLLIPLFWLLLNVLEANGINPWPLKILSFLSCANGGMSGGFIGGFGGIIGKGVFVAGIVTLFSLFFRKNGGKKRSFGETMKGAFGVTKDSLGVYFTGIGFALLIYLFLTGGATRISSLCGIAAMVIAADSALNNSFLVRIINSVFSFGKPVAGPAGAGLMRGAAVGYAISAVLGLITGTRIIPIILAVLFINAGVIFLIIRLIVILTSKKGGAAS
jgi:hypothetical protein